MKLKERTTGVQDYGTTVAIKASSVARSLKLSNVNLS